MTIVVAIVLCVAALPLWIGGTYLLVLTLLSGRPRAPLAGTAPPRRFVIVVPAHNEAAGIARTVASLLSLEGPADLRRVLVVADNCEDATAELAREAGAQVLERRDLERRGKGFALDHAFRHLAAEGWADAVVVVDADTVVSANLLTAFDAHLAAGADALQAFYGVLNPLASWRTRLITIALAIFHRLRSRGREALGVSCGLRGNGMGFTMDTLQRVPHEAFSIVEDLEYGIRLGRAGVRVTYVDEAEVLGEMVSTAGAARSQRQRWEGGRAQIARRDGLPLLREAIARRSALLLDLALDLLVPPLGTVAMAAAALALAALAAAAFGAIGPTLAVLLCAPAVFVVIHVLRGVSLSGLGREGWTTLAFAPAYLAWKLSLRFTGARPRRDDWVRTQREPPR